MGSRGDAESQSRAWEEIQRAFPALAREYDLRVGEVEAELRKAGYSGEIPETVLAARLKAERDLIVIGKEAWDSRERGAGLLMHEVAHAYMDTLQSETVAELRARWTHEREKKTGVLYENGKLKSDLRYVDEPSERGFREWFAERTARLNEKWAAGELEGAPVTAIGRAAKAVRDFLRKMWRVLWRGEARRAGVVNPDNALFEKSFRAFILEGGKRRDESAAEMSGAEFAKKKKQSGPQSWNEVRKGDRVKSVKSLMPKEADALPARPQGSLASVVDTVEKMLDSGPFTDPQGRVIEARVPDKGTGTVPTKRGRAEHLVTPKDRRDPSRRQNVLDVDKAKTVMAVPTTIADPQLIGKKGSTLYYLRRYADGTRHLVVADEGGWVKAQYGEDAALITQFPFDYKGGRNQPEEANFDDVRVVYKKAPPGKADGQGGGQSVFKADELSAAPEVSQVAGASEPQSASDLRRDARSNLKTRENSPNLDGSQVDFAERNSRLDDARARADDYTVRFKGVLVQRGHPCPSLRSKNNPPYSSFLFLLSEVQKISRSFASIPDLLVCS